MFVPGKVIKIIGLFAIMASFGACEHSEPTAAPPLQATFTSIQANIFTPRCVNAGCHPTQGNLLLTPKDSYSELVNQPSLYNMLLVAPFKPDSSALYLKVAGTDLGTRMPQGLDPLNSLEIEAIRQWIEDGALEN